MSADTPATCPKMLQPHDIHFMVINMDQSVKRLEKITQRFHELRCRPSHSSSHLTPRRLPMFERIAGVVVREGETYDVPMFYHPDTFRNGRAPIADYGCALAHRHAWQAVADGPNEWVMVIEVVACHVVVCDCRRTTRSCSRWRT